MDSIVVMSGTTFRLPGRRRAAPLGAPLPAALSLAIAAAGALASACAQETMMTTTTAAMPEAPSPSRPAATPKDVVARETAAARGNATGAVLTREELRRCMYEQLRLSAETDSLAETRRALDADRAEIARLGSELEARAAALDRSDGAAVEAYNAQAEARNALIARYETATARVNARVLAIEPARLAWSRDCADRPFRPQDRDAIGAGR